MNGMEDGVGPKRTKRSDGSAREASRLGTGRYRVIETGELG